MAKARERDNSESRDFLYAPAPDDPFATGGSFV